MINAYRNYAVKVLRSIEIFPWRFEHLESNLRCITTRLTDSSWANVYQTLLQLLGNGWQVTLIQRQNETLNNVLPTLLAQRQCIAIS